MTESHWKDKLVWSFKDIKMCLVLEVVILKGFKVSKFNKFIGSQCPITYLRLYHTIIVKVIHEEKLLMHHFHESLDDLALNRYMGFDRIKIKKWSHLAKAFKKHYQLNLELAHDRITSQIQRKEQMKLSKNMLKDGNELLFKSLLFCLKIK